MHHAIAHGSGSYTRGRAVLLPATVTLVFQIACCQAQSWCGAGVADPTDQVPTAAGKKRFVSRRGSRRSQGHGHQDRGRVRDHRRQQWPGQLRGRGQGGQARRCSVCCRRPVGRGWAPDQLGAATSTSFRTSSHAFSRLYATPHSPTVVLIGFTCPAITVVNVILRALDRVHRVLCST